MVRLVPGRLGRLLAFALLNRDGRGPASHLPPAPRAGPEADVAMLEASPTALHHDRGIPTALRLSGRWSETRDPERPKGPKSQFVLFVADARRQRPGIKQQELLVWAAERWKKMGPADKQPYLEAYRKDKERFDREFKAYKESGKHLACQRDPEKPVRPMNAYLMFQSAYITQQSPSSRKGTAQQLAKKASAKWKEMSAEEKEPYERRAADLMQAYVKEMETYRSTGKEAAWAQRKSESGTPTNTRRRRGVLKSMEAAQQAASEVPTAKAASEVPTTARRGRGVTKSGAKEAAPQARGNSTAEA